MGPLLVPFRSYGFALLLIAGEAGLVASFSVGFRQNSRSVVPIGLQTQSSLGDLLQTQESASQKQDHVSFVVHTHAPLDNTTGYKDPRTEVSWNPSPKHGKTTAGKGGWCQLVSLAACFLILGLVLSHEVVVPFMESSPFVAKLTVSTRRQGIQFTFFLFFMLLLMDTVVLIPTSYELAMATDCSAAVSGLLMGSSFLSTPFASILGATMFRYCSTRVTRGVALAGIFVLMAGNLIMALKLDAQDEHGPDTMWFLITVRFLCGFGKVALVIQQLTYNVTPHSDKVSLGLGTTVAMNMGLCLGPFLAATTIHMMGGREVVASVFSRTSPSIYLMAVLWAICALGFALTVPPDYRELVPDSQQLTVPSQNLSISIEDRKSIVFHGILFSAERAFTSRAIEAGSAMLLETDFGWGTRAIGFSISGVFAATIAVCIVIKLELNKGRFSDVNAFAGLTVVSCFGAVLLFDFHSGLAVQILLADVLMYPFMFAASGISDGLVTTLAVPDSWYSMESFLAVRIAIGGFVGFIAYPISRQVIDMGGRNLYAGLMVLMMVLGCISCAKIVGILARPDAPEEGTKA